MSVRTILLYPHKSGAVFNIEYYLKSHMPLVSKLYGPFGLENWEVVEFPTNDTPAYVVQTTLHWKNRDQLAAANASEGGKQLFNDIKNFSEATPIALTGDLVGKL
jgi:uncharacterized protein (TIGR02118 family)